MKLERLSYKNAPVTLSEIKDHLRITSSDFDADLVLKIKTATAMAEDFTGVCYMTSDFSMKVLAPGITIIPITIFPVQRVNSVIVDNIELSRDNYLYNDLDNTVELSTTGETVEVRFTAGALEVEFPVKAAILLMASALFNNPVDSVEQLSKASTNLLKPYRRWR